MEDASAPKNGDDELSKLRARTRRRTGPPNIGGTANADDECSLLKDALEACRSELASQARDHRQHIHKILLSILDVYDGMGRLLAAAEKQDLQKKALDFIEKRFGLSRKKLMQILTREGVLQINSLGQTFNPEHHDVLREEYIEGIAPNTIVAVESDGYVIHGDTLRMARVVVSAPESPATPSSEGGKTETQASEASPKSTANEDDV